MESLDVEYLYIEYKINNNFVYSLKFNTIFLSNKSRLATAIFMFSFLFVIL